MKKKLDCLVIRQPYASLIAFGQKRWEFRNYDCRKRGMICIASAKGKPFLTGSGPLNEFAKSFPRGCVLATAVLADSFLATPKELKSVLDGERLVEIHGHRIKLLTSPLGEPLKDILAAISDGTWEQYVWRFEDVSPLRKFVQLRDANVRSGARSWVKIELPENESFSRNLERYF